jgi:hypothetical protein
MVEVACNRPDIKMEQSLLRCFEFIKGPLIFIFSPSGYSLFVFRLGLAISLLFTGCTQTPMLKYGLDTTASVLVPIKYAGITDQRARFREIFCSIQQDHGWRLPDDRPCDQALHQLSDEPASEGRPTYLGPARLPLRFIVIPGLLDECVSDYVQPFSDARPHIESLGFKTDMIMVNGLAGSAQNAVQIRDAVRQMPVIPGEKLIFIGYSKGAADILEALSSYPEISFRTAAVITLAGVISGTPVADSLPDIIWKLADIVFQGKCQPGAGLAFESLTRKKRLDWLSSNKIPSSIRFYSLAAFSDRENISLLLRPMYDKLSLVDPRNDSQVVFQDALVPAGSLLAYLNADHWAIAVPFNRVYPTISEMFITRNAFPREVLLEAMARFIEEVLISDPNQEDSKSH